MFGSKSDKSASEQVSLCGCRILSVDEGWLSFNEDDVMDMLR